MLCNTDQLSTTQDTLSVVWDNSFTVEIEPSHPRVTTVRVRSQLGNNFVYLSRLNCGFPELGRALSSDPTTAYNLISDAWDVFFVSPGAGLCSVVFQSKIN